MRGWLQNKLLLVPGRTGAHNEAGKVELTLQGQAFLPDLSITGAPSIVC